MLEAKGLGFRAGDRWLLRDVSFRVRPGQCWVVAGANGAGKSTLLRLLSGACPPHEGRVLLEGKPLADCPPRALARVRAFLAQERNTVFPFTVYEMALMGRIPWQEGWSLRPRDEAIARRALERTGMAPFARRAYSSLSGGERSRVDMARVSAQEPRLLLLDEPTNHLDTRHQFDLMDRCREHAADGGAVIAVLHDLNLAARHADRILLLHRGRTAAVGTPDEVLTEDNMRRYFCLDCVIWRHPAGCPWVVPTGPAAEEPQRSLNPVS